MLLILPFACGGADSGEALPTPTVAFLAPEDGALVAAGEVGTSILVEDFVLSGPIFHTAVTDGGYLWLEWTDGEVTLSLGTLGTTPTVELDPGSWTLSATLIYSDGDEVSDEFPDFEPAVIHLTAE